MMERLKKLPPPTPEQVDRQMKASIKQRKDKGQPVKTQKEIAKMSKEYLGILPEEPARERWLVDLAKEYHTRTEAYDRNVCTGPILRGGIMPETPHQHRAIQRNATAVHRELFEKARQLGYTGIEWRKALHMALREIERQNPTGERTAHGTEAQNG